MFEARGGADHNNVADVQAVGTGMVRLFLPEDTDLSRLDDIPDDPNAPHQREDDIPILFSPICEINKRLCISGSAVTVALSPQTKAPRVAFVTLASLIKPYIEPLLFQPQNRPSIQRLVTGVSVDVSNDGSQWSTIHPNVMIFTVPAAQAMVKGLLETGVWNTGKDDNQSHAEKLVQLAILFPSSEKKDNIAGTTLVKFGQDCCCAMPKGTPITIIGSPYGAHAPNLFFSTLSTGVVANHMPYRRLDATQDGLAIISAPCFPGMAGAPVVVGDVNNVAQIFGVVLPALCRADGLLMELSFVLPWCQIRPLLRSAISQIGARNYSNASKHNLRYPKLIPQAQPRAQVPCDTMLQRAINATVLVSTSESWGTGVLVGDEGLVVTSAHTFKSAENRSRSPRISVRLAGNTWLPATLIHAVDAPDVALLRIRRSSDVVGVGCTNANLFKGLDWVPAEDLLSRAEDIVVIGFPTIPPHLTVSPTVSMGVCTSCVVTNLDGCAKAVLLKTSATVHPGSSGGPVVRLRDAKLLGIVASFAQSLDCDGTLVEAFPSLNFGIPVSLLDPIRTFVLNQKDESILDCMTLTVAEKKYWPSERQEPPQSKL
eukprot:m.11270 g.11270  ORF g.11270 m.11270 type:complete len:599 (-) comp8730_c0_seq2:140-1936(-)